MNSIREIYRIGRGPSSSHTMGPESACKLMKRLYPIAERFEVTLLGSLAKTGVGHRTDYAIYKAFEGIPVDIIFNTEEQLLKHPNTLKIRGFKNDNLICDYTFYSIGGGAIEIEGSDKIENKTVYSESRFRDVENVCMNGNISICQYIKNNEDKEIFIYLNSVWKQMKDTIYSGLAKFQTIPGGLGLKRRANTLYDFAQKEKDYSKKERYTISAYAYATSEENASGEVIVTAPTCGSAGVLPAVLMYEQQHSGFSDDEIVEALAVAGIIGNIVKTNASISGAECGCQAEVGTACAMASAALCKLHGLSLKQIECAAEIAIEHNLGLTCDPVKGLVQIPCIERNAAAALQAYDLANLAEVIYYNKKVSFDLVVKTMFETGKDLSCRYRETAEGGLASLFNNSSKF
ncbi:MAG: L-serine ammonia-lyase, iron-sulfur-dependent, subunit alpha [Clostridia bacterium]|nr:L-serine ammonia-lyase, iron-sulfur-dependent, subunit alpha [Clostridia bacterium]